jgi:hypothetical protein
LTVLSVILMAHFVAVYFLLPGATLLRSLLLIPPQVSDMTIWLTVWIVVVNGITRFSFAAFALPRSLYADTVVFFCLCADIMVRFACMVVKCCVLVCGPRIVPKRLVRSALCSSHFPPSISLGLLIACRRMA